jgi:hypothetical protein
MTLLKAEKPSVCFDWCELEEIERAEEYGPEMFIDRSQRKQVGRFVENSVTKFKRVEASPC